MVGMRGLMRSRRSGSPIRVVEETIAAIYEELSFSLNYLAAMLEQGNGRAAVEVIEEQRRSLARRAAAAEAAIVPRRRRRLGAAMVGLAATMLLASGAFAGWHLHRAPPGAGGPQAIRLASQALRTAITTEDPQALRQLVGEAQETILALAPQAATDAGVRANLALLLEQQTRLIRVNPHVPADVRRRAHEVETAVREEVEKAGSVDEPKAEEPKTEQPRADEPSAPSPPAAEAAAPAETS